MSVTNDKVLLFRSHECARGLSDEAVRDICDAAELVRYAPGDVLHRANDRLDVVYFIVHGRIKQSVLDIHGNPLLQRFLTRGSQFGALAAAQTEPVPVDVVAVEQVFFQNNVRTAMSVGQASGLALAEAALAGCEVLQYTPNQVKDAVAVQKRLRSAIRLDAS